MTRAVCLLPALLVAGALPLLAQSVRVSGSTHMRYIELRPLVADSTVQGELPGDGLLRQGADGRVVRCIPGEAYCYDVRPGPRVSALPVIHDVEISAWGFGRGAAAYAQLRGRNAFGNAELWPRGADELDVLAAYAELTRDRVRLRAGRQWKVSGLGFYNFDGLAVEARPVAAASVEVYAGRSLLRGLNEPRTGGALESIEALAPPSAGLLVGAHARYQPNRSFALSSVYQVDFRDDGQGLFSELFAADAVLQVRGIAIEGALELDLVSRDLNEARMRVRTPPFRNFAVHTEVRRYQPYFELWTIWGAFSPVGFDEARAGLTWADPAGRLIVQADGTYRAYGAAETDGGLADFREDGWGTGVSVTWLPVRGLRTDAAYRVETGVGAARRDAQLSVSQNFGERASLALHGVRFERLYEFRLDEGSVLGIGAEAALQLSPRARIAISGTTYRHVTDAENSGGDWNQRRASARVHWTIGPEPGMPRTASR